MKTTRLILTFMVLSVLLLLSGCDSQKGYKFPEQFPGSEETDLSGPFLNISRALKAGNSKECRSYVMPEEAPSIQSVFDHYQAEMEKQGWEGQPTEKIEQEFKLNATWLNEEENTGVMLIYMLDMWEAVVCVGYP